MKYGRYKFYDFIASYHRFNKMDTSRVNSRPTNDKREESRIRELKENQVLRPILDVLEKTLRNITNGSKKQDLILGRQGSSKDKKSWDIKLNLRITY